ncbi:NIPSNAP family protein [Mesorhizobium sp. 1M-11]|uniref:NIPSNAP family protein n=1 Tax=Mesorhizobium sp. 1M-11 TaxID=1529006 RepID=UPI001FCD550D|nr:NIPSNAP family protein [Mesorhizobium sp. 1M-11]
MGEKSQHCDRANRGSRCRLSATRRKILTGMLVAAWPAISPALAEKQKGNIQVIHQLRIYEIFEANKAAFHARFRDHAIRIMKKYGFDFIALWETQPQGRTEFVYLLRWPDEQTMTDAWARFMADSEWSEIKERTATESGSMVGQITERVLRPTDYSAVI